MAGPAEAFEVRVIISTAMCLCFDVVHRPGRYYTTTAQAVLANVFITHQHSCTDDVPLASIPTFMTALTLLVLLPPFITVLFAVS